LQQRYHNFNWDSLIGFSPKAFLIIRIFSADECPSCVRTCLVVCSI
jgi:hypothetical protein